MFERLLLLALFLLSVSIMIGLYRLIKGPTHPDRILALDSIGFNFIGVVGIISVMLHTYDFLEIILLIGILAFLGTIALSRYVEGGVVIKHERDD